MNRVGNLRAGIVLAMLALMTVVSLAASATAQESKKKEPRPRLPNYYRQVVTAEQREEITQIQVGYAAQIAKLREQLEELLEKRDAEVEKVLTPEQREKVAKLRQDAAARRREKSTAADSKPGDKQSVESTTDKTKKPS